MGSLEDLPLEMILAVLYELDVPELLHCRLVSSPRRIKLPCIRVSDPQ